jgi:hypothetical protein
MEKSGLELTGSRKVVSYESTLCDIPEERISHINCEKASNHVAKNS